MNESSGSAADMPVRPPGEVFPSEALADETKAKTTRGNPFGSDERPNTLFGEILDWLLAPLVLLWPISIVATNHVAQNLANEPYDRALADSVTAISRLIQSDSQRLSVNLPASTRTLLRSDDTDTVYFQIADRDGHILQGDALIPPIRIPTGTDTFATTTAVTPSSTTRVATHFRDDRIDGENVRVAYTFVRHSEAGVALVIQVAETLHKREALASRIITGVLLPQFAIVPLAVLLVWFGLARGILPLRQLRERLHRRRPADLSPIPSERVPDEVRPLVIAFNEMMGRLEDNLHARQRFIAQAAHQMRTPLTGLKTQTELALAETDPAQVRDALRLIAESTDRATHLITQLLMLARAEAGRETHRTLEAVDLAGLARSVAAEWAMIALRRKIDLGFECGSETLLISGVPLLLHELISNLIDNAVKYTPPGGHVTIRVAPTVLPEDGAPGAALDVEDDGIGIAEADRAHVFERFYRALGTGMEGSGLGLPIVAEIAELHDAEVKLETGSNGRGSLFRVVFPLTLDEDTDDDTDSASEPPRRDLGGSYPIGL